MHIGDQWMRLRSRDKTLDRAFARPFPVGVEYYRPPVPPPQYWDEDFRRISAAGMSIVRTWYSWDWVETLPNHYEFDDLDRLFDLAAQHGLKVWVDTPLGTHMACPAWMLRSHPDMRIVRRDGSVATEYDRRVCRPRSDDPQFRPPNVAGLCRALSTPICAALQRSPGLGGLGHLGWHWLRWRVDGP